MKKLIFSAVALCMGVCAMAQSNFYVYKSDGTEVEFAVDEVDSISFVKPPIRAISAVFSVASDKTVKFSSGNLQYTRSTQKWSFAENQYDFIGIDNVVDASFDAKSIEWTGKDLADKIDLFGWSADKGAQKWGVDTVQKETAYAGDFADWGQNIGDGSTWRTLTIDEWEYLFYSRNDYKSKYGTACIKLSETDSVNGMVLLPDNWTLPDGVVFKSGFSDKGTDITAYAAHQTFSLAQWQLMEQAGAVFLPAAGHRANLTVDIVALEGCYWSATEVWENEAAKFFDFQSSYLEMKNDNRFSAYSVRLVQDVK